LTDIPPLSIELLVECKYSLKRGTVTAGVPQILAYWYEYLPPAEVERIHMVVCPETVINRPQSWQGKLALGTPDHLRTLVAATIQGRAAEVLGNWA